MEFAQINAIARSAYFPPYDPWYSDGYLNYYYYGFYLVAFLLKATGIPAEIGFNLALPTMMGMLASGGFSVAAALARGLTRSSRMAIVGGWSAVLVLCLLGNLSALHRLLEGIPARFDPFLFWTWGGSRAIDNVITEFPYFTGLYADLHAHVVALPLTVATIATCLAIAATRLPETPALADRRALDRPGVAPRHPERDQRLGRSRLRGTRSRLYFHDDLEREAGLTPPGRPGCRFAAHTRRRLAPLPPLPTSLRPPL